MSILTDFKRENKYRKAIENETNCANCVMSYYDSIVKRRYCNYGFSVLFNYTCDIAKLKKGLKMTCKKCGKKLFFKSLNTGFIQIICPNCGIRTKGKVKSKELLQDVKLKDVEVAI